MICVRRRGLGLTTSGQSCDHEVELLGRLIDALDTGYVRCLALGSAAPMGLKLYERFEPVRAVDFVNIASAAVPDNAIQNKYLKSMVAQSIVGLAGAKMVVSATKFQMRRKGPIETAKSVYAPSTDDVAFLEEHPDLMWDAFVCFSAVSSKIVRDEIVSAFMRNHEPVDRPDKDGFCVFTGPDVPEVFKSNAEEFSKKCGAELREFSKGGVMSIYICAEEYADFVRSRNSA